MKEKEIWGGEGGRGVKKNEWQWEEEEAMGEGSIICCCNGSMDYFLCALTKAV